jgi:Rrf2 family transcriptional regulator, iron-sulfur cluster assembly transcription factor
MRLSKTTEYAVRALTFMAQNLDSLVSVNALSKTLGIPYKYLARLMTQLSQAGLVDSAQGKKGGYRIARPLNEIYLYHVVDTVEGLANYHRCVLGFPECNDEDPCSMHHLWEPHLIGIRHMIYENTLADLNLTGKM